MKIQGDFEGDLEAAALDAAAVELLGSDGALTNAIEQAHSVLRGYGSQYDYDVEPIIESLQEPELVETSSGIRIQWGWEHEAAPYFEWGVSEHTIDGDPILSFVWEDPPAWVEEEFEPEGDGYRVFFGSVDHPGLPEARFARSVLDFLRQEVA